MRALYDHQIFQVQEVGGISLYFSEFAKQAPGFDVDLAPKFSNK